MNIFTAQSNIWKPSLGSHVLHTFRLKPQILAQDFSSRYRFWQIYIYAVHELAPARQSVMFFDLVQHELDSAHKITTISWDPCTAQLTCMFENQSNVDRSRPSFLWPKSLAADTHATSRSMSVSMYT